MNKSVYKTLLGLKIYEISPKYIEEIRQLNPNREKFANNLPEYCVTNTQITTSEYYFPPHEINNTIARAWVQHQNKKFDALETKLYLYQ